MENRIKQLERQVIALRAQGEVFSCLLQALLQHMAENDGLAEQIADSIEGWRIMQLQDATLADRSMEMFTPLLLALLPNEIRDDVAERLL